MLRNYIHNIEDLERLYYSRAGSQLIQKADAPVLTTTTGVYNAVFGAKVWANLNLEANAFGVLPKTPWLRSGWRVITARASATVTGGVAENAALPDTLKPTFLEVSTKPKTVAHNFDVSEVHEFLSTESADDVVGDLAFMRQYMGQEHKEHVNKMLLTDVDTLASNSIESLDRVVSTYGEVTNCGITAGDSDIFSIDRDAATGWSDAFVSHNSNTDRELTDTLLRTIQQNVLTNGANPDGQLWFTGYDTFFKITGLYEPQVRYASIGEKDISIGVNGVETPKGGAVGLKVSTLYGKPLILSKNTPQDTISRLYLLDTSNPEGFDIPRLCIKIAKPTQYFEAGMNTGDPFGINRLGNEGMYRTMGELICTFFAAQGKIRDLQ